MRPIDRAVARIDQVLDSNFDPRTAYPLRARLGRAVLACTRAVDELPGSPSPESIRVLTRLNAATAHVMQPSEPFDTHWQDQWKDVLQDLRTVRQLMLDRR